MFLGKVFPDVQDVVSILSELVPGHITPWSNPNLSLLLSNSNSLKREDLDNVVLNPSWTGTLEKLLSFLVFPSIKMVKYPDGIF